MRRMTEFLRTYLNYGSRESQIAILAGCLAELETTILID